MLLTDEIGGLPLCLLPALEKTSGIAHIAEHLVGKRVKPAKVSVVWIEGKASEPPSDIGFVKAKISENVAHSHHQRGFRFHRSPEGVNPPDGRLELLHLLSGCCPVSLSYGRLIG